MAENKVVEEKMVFVVNNQESLENSDLLHLEWAVISQLDGKKTVGQIADNLALNTAEIQEIFDKLIDANLLVQVDGSFENDLIPIDFFKQLSHEMTYLLGPVASIVLEDVVELMHINKENMSKSLLPSLIDLITNQIDDPVKQVEFQKRIYPKVKPLIFQ
jgi:hypothetical protein